jgi:hypothetical protein
MISDEAAIAARIIRLVVRSVMQWLRRAASGRARVYARPPAKSMLDKRG